MNKAALIEKVAERLGGDDYRDDPGLRAAYQREAARAVDKVLSTILAEMVQGGSVQVTGFGTFKVTDIPGRNVRNPKSGKFGYVEAHRRAKFIPGQNMHDLINGLKPLPDGDASAIKKTPKGSAIKKK